MGQQPYSIQVAALSQKFRLPDSKFKHASYVTNENKVLGNKTLNFYFQSYLAPLNLCHWKSVN